MTHELAVMLLGFYCTKVPTVEEYSNMDTEDLWDFIQANVSESYEYFYIGEIIKEISCIVNNVVRITSKERSYE